MKNFKRLMAILLAVLMLTFAVACTKENKTTDNAPSKKPIESSEPTPSPAPSLDVVSQLSPDVQSWGDL